MERREIEEKLLNRLYRYPVVIGKNISLYHAGGKGTDFFDVDRLTCDPESQKELSEEIEAKVRLLEKEGMYFDKMAFIDKESGPVGTILLASTLSQDFKKKIIILRPWSKLKWDHIKVKGWIENIDGNPIKPNDSILLIDDVITTGSIQKDAIEIVERYKAKVTGLVCVFVRDTEAVEDIKREKKIKYVKTIWNYDELVYRGLVIAQPDKLLTEDFVKEFVNRVLPEKKVPEAEREINAKLQKMIFSLLEEENISADETIKLGLKNLLFNSVLYSYRERLVATIKKQYKRKSKR